jgi:hypothetical protein
MTKIVAIVGGINAAVTLIVSINKNSVTLYLIGYWALLVALCLWIALFATGFLVGAPITWAYNALKGDDPPDATLAWVCGVAYAGFAVAALLLIIPGNGPSSTDTFGKVSLSVCGWLILVAPFVIIAYLKLRERTTRQSPAH